MESSNPRSRDQDLIIETLEETTFERKQEVYFKVFAEIITANNKILKKLLYGSNNRTFQIWCSNYNNGRSVTHALKISVEILAIHR